jgi:hypothetical protein
MHTSGDWRRAELLLVEPTDYAGAVSLLYAKGARNFLLRPHNQDLADRLIAHFGASLNLYQQVADDVPIDAVVIPPLDAAALDAELLSYLDRPVALVGPRTELHLSRRSLFVLTVPKAGTHLLFHLLHEFGLTPGLRYVDRLEPATYYFLVHDHSHIPAAEFFEHLTNQPRGGADHPFFHTPALFIYRNPLDVLVSEVFYYVKRDKSALAYYYEDMTPEERCLELIRGEPLLPSLRGRMLQRAPYLRLKNVLPLCYEELVGPRGGGQLEAQARAIWGLQLKLQAPGSPTVYGDKAYSEQSGTFRKGRINDHKEFLTAAHQRELRKLPQDFMHLFGYDMDDEFTDGYLPRRVEEFRRRRLNVSR